MAAPTLVQELTAVQISASETETTVNALPSDVTAGNTLVLILHQHAAGARTYEVDDSSDSYATLWTRYGHGTKADIKASIYARTNMPAGAITVKCTSNFSIVKYLQLLEISDCEVDGSAYGGINGASTDVDGNGYPCSADATVIDTSADVFVISAMSHQYSGPTLSAGTGYTGIAGYPAHYGFAQWKASTSALTNERAYIAETGTNRNYGGAIVSLVNDAAGGTTGEVFLPYMKRQPNQALLSR